jgi:hypothetical protein
MPARTETMMPNEEISPPTWIIYVYGRKRRLLVRRRNV